MTGMGKAWSGLRFAAAAGIAAGFAGIAARFRARRKPSRRFTVVYDDTGLGSAITVTELFEELALSAPDWEDTPVEAHVYLRYRDADIIVRSQRLMVSVEDGKAIITVKMKGACDGEGC